jgi:hypothetical protein
MDVPEPTPTSTVEDTSQALVRTVGPVLLGLPDQEARDALVVDIARLGHGLA